MQKLLSAGFYRLSRSAAFWAFAAFSASCGALSAFSTYLNQPEAGQEFSIFGFAFFIPMFSAPFTAVVLGTEFSDNTVRNKIIAGHKKSAVYFSYIAVAALASAAMCVLSAAVHFAVGLPLLGLVKIPFAEFALFFAVGILSTVAMTVLTAVITLSTHSRAVAAAVCAVLAAAAISLSANIGLRLKETEYLSVTDLEAIEISGELSGSDGWLIPDPDYPTPEQRKTLELLFDIQPGGAAAQSAWLEVERPLRVIIFEALWILLHTAAGYLVFKRRNIR